MQLKNSILNASKQNLNKISGNQTQSILSMSGNLIDIPTLFPCMPHQDLNLISWHFSLHASNK
jgi:hypothetical protein